MRGKLWRVIRRMYDVSRIAVLLEGEKSRLCGAGSSIGLYIAYVQNINLLKEVEKAN